MKVRDVPQDPQTYVPGGYVRYAVDEEGRYQKIHSTGSDEQTLANTLFWEYVDRQIALAAQRVKEGVVSPLAYYMALGMLECGPLAGYVGLTTWSVRRHLKPKVFQRLRPSLLQRYADFFEVSLEELRHPALDRPGRPVEEGR